MHKVGRQLVTGGLLNAKLQKLNIDCFNQLVYIHVFMCIPMCTLLKKVLENHKRPLKSIIKLITWEWLISNVGKYNKTFFKCCFAIWVCRGDGSPSELTFIRRFKVLWVFRIELFHHALPVGFFLNGNVFGLHIHWPYMWIFKQKIFLILFQT